MDASARGGAGEKKARPFSSSLIVRHGESVGDVEEDVAQGIRGVLLDDVGG